MQSYSKKEEGEETIIPSRYLDPVTGQFLKEPYIYVQTGEIYDKKTLQAWFDKAKEQKDLLPLPDFSAAIKQYQNSVVPYQNLTSENSNKQVVNNDSQEKELFQQVVNFQTMVKEQNEKVEAAKKVADSFLKEINEKFGEYMQLQKTCVGITVEVNQIVKCVDDKEIQNLEVQIDQDTVNVQSNFKEYCKAAKILCKKQKLFAQNLQKLQLYEKKLVEVQDKFNQLNKQIDAVTFFKNIAGQFSQRFTGTPVKSSQLQGIFSYHLIENKNLIISSQDNVPIQIILNSSTSIAVKNVQITNTGNTNYLEFVLNQSTKITFENCSFSFIGLKVINRYRASNGYQSGFSEDNVSVKNFLSNNSPSCGIIAEHCQSCTIENSHIDNSSGCGIIIDDVQKFGMTNVQLSNSGKHGIRLEQTDGTITDSTIYNSAQYGIFQSIRGYYRLTDSNSFIDNCEGDVGKCQLFY